MNEIYWITRFDSINLFCITIFIITVILSVGIGVAYFGFNGQYIHDKYRGFDSDAKEQEGYRNTCVKILKWLVPVTTIFSLLVLFIPSTKEALFIYGVGGTVDYIKQNPTAKQLPDKCVKALDKWVDSYIEEKDSLK